ncbi:hypothetical protein HNP46_000314 [Pseudomonas nitritireducens]|uniref:Uncharacterized protein n=1 Tax=Pseudomonas nitroreducens TaxID=46680 RepID=A0A7W7NYA9_PSENT|nr:hypothetical protein [Pseudomonas nitritireducens]MBB4861503.1 hypothetical protein [Pseudomonas nitritireducens]
MTEPTVNLNIQEGLHGAPWGWDLSSADGYTWGTAQTELDACGDALEALRKVQLRMALEAIPKDKE